MAQQPMEPPAAAPQPPQFMASVCVFTHRRPHIVFGAMHPVVHAPAVQPLPVAHAWPHMPQLVASV